MLPAGPALASHRHVQSLITASQEHRAAPPADRSLTCVQDQRSRYALLSLFSALLFYPFLSFSLFFLSFLSSPPLSLPLLASFPLSTPLPLLLSPFLSPFLSPLLRSSPGQSFPFTSVIRAGTTSCENSPVGEW